MFLITGCPRSGTKYTAEFLNSTSLNVQHEYYKGERKDIDGRVGWMSICFGFHWKVLENLDQYGIILHQVRNPVDTISSFTVSRFFHERKNPNLLNLLTLIGVTKIKSPIGKYMKFWVEWNKICEKKADWTYKVEDLSTNEKILKKLLKYVGLKNELSIESRNKLNMLNINTRKKMKAYKKISIEDMYGVDATLADEIIQMAKRYGYE